MDLHEDITQMLQAAGASEGTGPEDLGALFEAVYPRLRELARSKRAQWQGNDTLSATVLVHEAYLKVAGGQNARFESRGHFFAGAARAMRQVLINYAEAQRAERRGGGARNVTLLEEGVAKGGLLDGSSEDLISLEDALTRLEALSARQARVVECRFFAGLDLDETAEALEISRATVKRDWTMARAFLYREMRSAAGEGES